MAQGAGEPAARGSATRHAVIPRVASTAVLSGPFLVAVALAFAGTGIAEEPESRMAPAYERFSHRVAIEWGEEFVTLRLPAADGSPARTLRLPGWPVPRPEPGPAPSGVVGVGVDGSLLINARPQTLPRPKAAKEEPSGGFVPPRGPGPVLARVDLSALVGILIDGFPLYGPLERDGQSAGGLDDCGGHVGFTPDHERPIYHYHVTPGRARICGCLRGTPLPEARR